MKRLLRRIVPVVFISLLTILSISPVTSAQEYECGTYSAGDYNVECEDSETTSDGSTPTSETQATDQTPTTPTDTNEVVPDTNNNDNDNDNDDAQSPGESSLTPSTNMWWALMLAGAIILALIVAVLIGLARRNRNKSV